MKLLNWPDVNIVIKTIIENKIDLSNLKEDDLYLIEKLTDDVFSKVREKELSNCKLQESSIKIDKTLEKKISEIWVEDINRPEVFTLLKLDSNGLYEESIKREDIRNVKEKVFKEFGVDSIKELRQVIRRRLNEKYELKKSWM